ncbi:hypothetical protein AC1031_004372 [Aphanomyces cochlioides]|nr:hypothetical protein AC1031_004372 [Aphanomyces cochlioides]
MKHSTAHEVTRELSAGECNAFLALGKSACIGLIQNALALAALPVHSTVQNRATANQATIHRGWDIHEPTRAAYCSVSTMEASLADFGGFFHLDSPEEYNAFAETLSPHFIARKHLFTVQEARESIGLSASIAWYAHRVMPLVASRDLCVLEYRTAVEIHDDIRGHRKGWVRCLHSVEIDDCPPLRGYRRSRLSRSGHLVLETDMPGIVEVFSVVIPEYGGRLLSCMATKLTHRHLSHALKIEEYIAKTGLIPWLDDTDGPDIVRLSEFTQKCSRCDRSFSWRRRRRECRVCYKTICKKCATQWKVPLGPNQALTDVFVCPPCLCPKDIRPRASGRTMMLSCTDAQRERLRQLAAQESPTPEKHTLQTEDLEQLIQTTNELVNLVHELTQTFDVVRSIQ